jgi:hypothetical protein
MYRNTAFKSLAQSLRSDVHWMHPIAGIAARGHNPVHSDSKIRIAMQLFLPNARAINVLLIVGFCSMGYALYMRYLVIEQSSVGLSCVAHLNTWLCWSRELTIAIFTRSIFGVAAIAMAILNLLRPSPILFAIALSAACFGIVLYNVELSALAAGLLILSLARRVPASD